MKIEYQPSNDRHLFPQMSLELEKDLNGDLLISVVHQQAGTRFVAFRLDEKQQALLIEKVQSR